MAKYPRTPHLPNSPGGTRDDRRLDDVSVLVAGGRPVVVTEKMDGSNVCLTSNHVFARSHAGPPGHRSFDALKQFHAGVRHLIDDNLSVFGEWCFARHSISYDALPAYLLIFAVREHHKKYDLWWSWDEVEMMAGVLGVPTAPVLLQTGSLTEETLLNTVERLGQAPSAFGGDREGVVVRVRDGFFDDAFDLLVAKYVRANHVQTDGHWKHQEIIRNRLA